MGFGVKQVGAGQVGFNPINAYKADTLRAEKFGNSLAANFVDRRSSEGLAVNRSTLSDRTKMLVAAFDMKKFAPYLG